MTRLRVATLILALCVLATPVGAEPAQMTVYKSPTCGCCVHWIDHLEAAGFEVEAIDVADTRALKHEHGVPAGLDACHTAKVGGYVVEGHVPAADILRLLDEKPKVVGITVPGMPLGSPGMEVADPSRHQAYQVLSFDKDGKTQVFSTHDPKQD